VGIFFKIVKNKQEDNAKPPQKAVFREMYTMFGNYISVFLCVMGLTSSSINLPICHEKINSAVFRRKTKALAYFEELILSVNIPQGR
jgi:hypothetical protein